jgi:hypothetical protein
MRKIVLAAAVLACAAGGLGAQEKPKSKWDYLKVYFQHLKQGLTESAVQGEYQRGRGAAVAAVRGSAQDDGRADPDKPVLMQPSKTRRRKAEAAERREFEKAVDSVEDGLQLKDAAKVDEGAAGLEAFEKAHPKSARLGEVREALAKAREIQGLLKSGEAPAAAEPAKAP